MDYPEFAKGIADWISIPVGALIFSFTIVAIIWMCWRARSLQPIVRRIWRFVAGEPIFIDNDIQKILQLEAQLQYFRVESGIPCRTLAEARRINTWIEENDETLQSVSRVGRNFDIVECKFNAGKIDHPLWSGFAFIGSTLSFVFFMFIFTISQQNTAWLKFISSGTHFSLTKDVAKIQFNSKAMPLRIEDCEKITEKLTLSTGFSKDETEDLCKFLKDNDENKNKLIQNTVKEQKLIAIYSSPLLIFLAFFLGNYVRTSNAARDMSERLQKRQFLKNSMAVKVGNQPLAELPQSIDPTHVKTQIEAAAPTGAI